METNTNNLDWFFQFKKTEEYKMFLKNPIAYFCAEYALQPSFPTYAGGLGVLSGDFIREAALQEFPLFSVGLCYEKAQSILSQEKEQKKYNLHIAVDKNNQEILVEVPIEDRIVKAKAFMWEEGKTKVYLLSTDIEENIPEDREITKCLYDENRDVRLKQEILLGIGGFRLLAKLGYHSSVYHMNEGHSAFLALELVRHEMEHQHVDFITACGYAKRHTLFTNHTLVLAGQEQFDPEKVKLFIRQYAKEIDVDPGNIAAFGMSENHPGVFSMTTFSFNLSLRTNAVSKLHLEKAKKVWPEYSSHSMDAVTNGIFIQRWDKVKNENILDSHLANKMKLLALVKDKTGENWSDTDLVLVWARRLVEYKQPLLFFENVTKLAEILRDSPVQVRIIFSGPTQETENPLVVKLKKIFEEKLKGFAVFIPHYNTEVAEILTAGADVWLNTPMVGFEACGTSGMKAALNGALALSTNDGWVHEVEPRNIGWVVGGTSKELHSVLEKEIIPMYHDSIQNGTSSEWVKNMTTTRNFILENFSTTRALREYIEKLYIPILKQKHTHKID